MTGRDWLDAVLGLGPKWKVTRVEPQGEPKERRVELHRTGVSPLRCPHCGEACPGYDTRRREWRNLDAWGYKIFLVCNVPRIQRPEHGVVTPTHQKGERTGFIMPMRLWSDKRNPALTHLHPPNPLHPVEPAIEGRDPGHIAIEHHPRVDRIPRGQPRR